MNPTWDSCLGLALRCLARPGGSSRGAGLSACARSHHVLSGETWFPRLAGGSGVPLGAVQPRKRLRQGKDGDGREPEFDCCPPR